MRIEFGTRINFKGRIMLGMMYLLGCRTLHGFVKGADFTSSRPVAYVAEDNSPRALTVHEMSFLPLHCASWLRAIEFHRIPDRRNNQHKRHARNGGNSSHIKNAIGRTKNPCGRMEPQRYVSQRQ